MLRIGHRSWQTVTKLLLKGYTGTFGHLSLEVQELWRARPPFGVVLTTTRLGLLLRYLGLALLALAAATSSITFSWIIEHNRQENFFPEFAGRVVYLSDIFLVGGLAFWTLGWRLSPRQSWRYGPWYVFLPLLLLAVLTVLSMIWAGDAGLAGYSALRRSLLLAMYLVLVNEFARASATVVIPLFFVGLLQAGIALAQVSQGSAVGVGALGELTEGMLLYEWIGFPRGFGAGFNPNPAGLFLAVVSAVGFGLFLLNRNRWHMSALMLVLFIVTSLGLVTTQSRAAVLGLLLGLFVVTTLAWLWNGQTRKTIARRVGVVTLLVLLIVSLSSVFPSVGRFSMSKEFGIILGRFQSGARSEGIQGRVRDLKLSLPIIREKFFLGVGAGNYPRVLKERLDPGAVGPKFVPVHNVPLLLYAELGIGGAVAWAFIMAAPIIWGLWRRNTSRVEPQTLLWLGPLLVLLVVGLFEFTPWATQDGRVLMMAVLGLWAGGVAAGNKKRSPPERS